MSKSPAVTSAMSSTAAPASPAPARLSPSAIANMQSRADVRDVDVVEWGNGEPADGSSESAPAMAREGNIFVDREVKPQPGEPDHPDELKAKPKDERGAETAEADAETPVVAKETPTEKRQRALDSLSAEKRARGLEQTLKETQGKLDAAGKATLAEILAAKGISKDDLLEKLLTGSDGLELPPKLEGDAAVLAELKTRLDAAEKKLKDRDEAESSRQIQDAIRTVASDLEGAGVPVIEALGAHDQVLNEAFALWKAAGSEGSSREHIPQAAENVERRLRKANPRLAALADAAEKGKTPTAAAAAALAPARPGITRRTAARPNGKPAPLPMDPQERDAAIKKELGWS